jgi:hypothetical protein
MALLIQWPMCVPAEPVKCSTTRSYNAAAFIASRSIAASKYVPTDKVDAFTVRTQLYARMIRAGTLVFGENGPPGSAPLILWDDGL